MGCWWCRGQGYFLYPGPGGSDRVKRWVVGGVEGWVSSYILAQKAVIELRGGLLVV